MQFNLVDTQDTTFAFGLFLVVRVLVSEDPFYSSSVNVPFATAQARQDGEHHNC